MANGPKTGGAKAAAPKDAAKDTATEKNNAGTTASAEAKKPEPVETRALAPAKLVGGAGGLPPARTAEEMKASRKDHEKRQREAAQSLGAHASDKAGVEALAETTNQATIGAGLAGDTAGGVREKGAGFERHGEEVKALGANSRMLPLQHTAPVDKDRPDAVTNQPFGSEPGFVDPKTGLRTFQPKTKEHLAGQGVAPQGDSK